MAGSACSLRRHRLRQAVRHAHRRQAAAVAVVVDLRASRQPDGLVGLRRRRAGRRALFHRSLRVEWVERRVWQRHRADGAAARDRDEIAQRDAVVFAASQEETSRLTFARSTFKVLGLGETVDLPRTQILPSLPSLPSLRHPLAISRILSSCKYSILLIYLSVLYVLIKHVSGK